MGERVKGLSILILRIVLSEMRDSSRISHEKEAFMVVAV